MAFNVFLTTSRLYFSGLLRRLSISKVVSCTQIMCGLESKQTSGNQAMCVELYSMGLWLHTSASSLPASFLYALVHFTFLGLRFILKFLWHFDLQNLNTCNMGLLL